MKNSITTILCFLFISVQIMSAQDYALASTNIEARSTKVSKKEIIKAQEDNFQVQIERKISQLVDYPQHLVDNRIEGSVYAQILFNDSYNDYSVHIIKGDKANLGTLVKKAISKIDILSYLPPKFEGKQSFVFNIDFLLDQ